MKSPKIKGGLRELYRTLELPGANPLKDAHAALNTAVLAAYGFHPAKDLLAQLLDLNQAVAAHLAAGKSANSPGLNINTKDRYSYITADCILPATK